MTEVSSAPPPISPAPTVSAAALDAATAAAVAVALALVGLSTLVKPVTVESIGLDQKSGDSPIK